MNKVLKKSTFTAILLIVMLVCTMIVNADSHTYNSTISISDNSTVYGSVRDFEFPNAKIAITPKELSDGPLATPGMTELTIELRQPKKIFGWEYDYVLKGSGKLSWVAATQVGTTKTLTTANCGTGNRYYYFSTLGKWGGGYGSLSGTANITTYS